MVMPDLAEGRSSASCLGHANDATAWSASYGDIAELGNGRVKSARAGKRWSNALLVVAAVQRRGKDALGRKNQLKGHHIFTQRGNSDQTDLLVQSTCMLFSH